MSNNAMSNETDLDWLARNVHVWPAGDHQPWCYVYIVAGGAMKASGNFLDAVAYPIRITKDQWLARRAELQNKPSWDHEAVPAWATALAQDQDGEWKWLGDNVAQYVDGFTADKIRAQCKGVVLGSWRDTLEKRPEEFKPFTSVEGNQEQDMKQQHDMKQDNGWFERGELPPVGVECLYVVSDRLSAEVEITAHAKFGLCFVEVGKSGENYVSKTAELHRFRPVRTERDVLLSIIVEEMNRYDTDGKLADAILAAGFSLRDK
ncbi:hypothetical protein [Aeromonas phage 51]|uniref:Uncharacterized protein n=3 Tax=Popoffvirus pv56 TaxID=2560283 RepID=A0A219YB61_9CAUD|nr:hypothetical protein F394_gp08 [Aeromonas phage vB_AsaM-56]AFC22604.1 hypothetical protein AsaM-56_0008 [Aeromonas phage vB_AsaM-56]APU01231.1 hypothetical protein [Aeromonas phage 51]APU01315.1 hypothetical protein [Aeromonas phage 56]